MGDEYPEDLLRGCLDKNRADQKKLYETFYGFAMGICLRYAGNRYEAAEILNQGYFKVFNGLAKYDPAKPFKGWLGRIMINTAVDYYRSNIKTSYTEDLDGAMYVDSGDLPDGRLKYDDLLAMVQRLPQACRTVFNLFAIEGYSHDEIGILLGISTGTSKSNLFKARDKLRKMILADEVSPARQPGQSGLKFITENVYDIKIKPITSLFRDGQR